MEPELFQQLDPEETGTDGANTDTANTGAADTGGVVDQGGGDQSGVSQDPGTTAGQEPAADSDAGAGASRTGTGSDAAGQAQGAAAAAAGTQPAAPQRQDVVPHAALHEARELNRALRQQIAELQAQPKLSAEDRTLLEDLKAQRAAAATQAQVPDFVEDPKGYVDAKVGEAIKKLDTVATETKETREQVAQREQLAQLAQSISSKEQEFAAKNPDYISALDHTRAVRAEQLRMLLPDATDQQIAQQIGREELGAAQQILARGGNPAEFAYKYAKTLGFQSKPSSPPPAAAAPPASAAAASTTPSPDVPDRSAARTLGSGGGGEDPEATEDVLPELSAALNERFGVRRRG